MRSMEDCGRQGAKGAKIAMVGSIALVAVLAPWRLGGSMVNLKLNTH